MSNLVTVNSGSAIDGTLKAGRISIATSASIDPSDFYEMINPAGGYVFITDPKVQGYNDGPPQIFQSPSTLPADTLATINGLPDRRDSVPFDNVWDALKWVQSTGKYFILDKTLSGGNSGTVSFAFLPNHLSSYPQSGSISYNLGGDVNGDLINSPTFNLGGWFDFDGVDEYIYFDNLDPIDVYSFEVVFKPHKTIAPGVAPDNSDYSLIGINRDIGNNNGINVYEWTGGMTNETVSIWSHDGYATGITDTVDVNFHHMCFNWNGSTYDIWLDGEKKSTIQRTTGHARLLTNVDGIVPGYNVGYNYYHQGSIADVKAHTRSLTDNEILQNYFGSNIVTDSLSYRWDAGNLVSYDKTSTTTFALTGSISGSLNNGVEFHSEYEGYWEFDGSNDNIILEGSTDSFRLNQGDNWTVNAWVRTTQVGSAIGDAPIMSNSQSGPVWSVFKIHNGKIGFSHYNNAWLTSLGSVDVNDGDWHMLTWSNLGDGTMDLYVDGVLDTAGVDSALSAANRIDAIGRSWSAYFDGDIANVQVNKGTSFNASQVAQQYGAESSRFKSSRDISKEGLVLDLDAADPNSYLSGTTWTDLSGKGNNGTLTNSPVYSIDNGGAFIFDGVDDYVALGNLNTDIYNISLWVYLDSNVTSAKASTGLFYYGGNDTRQAGVSLGASTGFLVNETLTILNEASGGSYQRTGIIDVIPAGWRYISFNWNGSSYDIYIDGDKKTTYSGSSTGHAPLMNAANFELASNYDGNPQFEGKIASVKIYSQALDEYQIILNYNTQSPHYRVQLPRSTTDSLVLNLDAGDTTSYPREGTTWYDRSGKGHSVTLYNNPEYNFVDGGTITFDGTDDYGAVALTGQNFDSTGFTLETWVKLLNEPGAWRTTFNIENASNSNHIDIRNSNGYGRMTINYYPGSSDINAGSVDINENEWYHLAGVWDGSNLIFYVNGEQTGSIASMSSLNLGTSPNFQIGRAYSNNRYINDEFSLVKVYNRGLSPSEIRENYKSTRSRFGTDGHVTSNLQLYLDAGNIDSFDNSNTTWTDLTGQYNATLTNGPTFHPRVGGVINFDGTNDRADNSAAPLADGQTQYTIEAVFKPESEKTQVIWEQNTSNLQTGRRVCMILISDGDGGFNGQSADRHDQLPYYVGKYQHWIITVDTNLASNQIKMYVNGELSDQGNPSSTLNAGAEAAAVGVKVSSDSEYFDGDIPLVRVYNDVLTAAEALQNYNSVKNRFGLD